MPVVHGFLTVSILGLFMAVKDPKAKRTTIAYTGGTVSAARGLIEWVFGAQNLGWSASNIGTTPSGRRKFKYGARRRTSASAGKSVMVELTNGETYSFRVTGDVIDFVEQVIGKRGSMIEQIYTKRGSMYSRTVKAV